MFYHFAPEYVGTSGTSLLLLSVMKMHIYFLIKQEDVCLPPSKGACLHLYIFLFLYSLAWIIGLVEFLLRQWEVFALAQIFYSRIMAPHIMKHMENINWLIIPHNSPTYLCLDYNACSITSAGVTFCLTLWQTYSVITR